MKKHIDVVKRLYESDDTPLTESIRSASSFELDMIIESMDRESLISFSRKLMEFEEATDKDFSLLTKIGKAVFGDKWANDRVGKNLALRDRAKFDAAWTQFSQRFNLPLTVDNLKKFVKTEYDMSPKTADLALADVKPKLDRRTKEITNIEDIIPALSYQYFMGVGDAIEDRAEENHIDIDDLGYDQLPQNNTTASEPAQGEKPKAAPAGDAPKADEPAAESPEEAPAEPEANKDPGSMSSSQISTQMGKTLNSLHVSANDRQQAISDSKKGFTQSYSKNSRTLAAMGYAYLKAIKAV